MDLKRIAELLEERLEVLFGDGFFCAEEMNLLSANGVEQRWMEAAEALFGRQSRLSLAAETADVPSSGRSFGSGGEGTGKTEVTQNIYLKENDPSPYKTARAIRRESEAMLRL